MIVNNIDIRIIIPILFYTILDQKNDDSDSVQWKLEYT